MNKTSDHRTRRATFLTAIVLVASLAFVGSASAGSHEITISGTVTSPSGAVLGNVLVGVFDGGTLIGFTGTDGVAGTYALTVPAGTYTVGFEHHGFAQWYGQTAEQSSSPPVAGTTTADHQFTGIHGLVTFDHEIVVEGGWAPTVAAWTCDTWPAETADWTGVDCDDELSVNFHELEPDGSFELLLQPSTYRVRYTWTDAATNHGANGWWAEEGMVRDVSAADDVVVSAGGSQPAASIEATLESVQTEPPDGALLGNGWVTLDATFPYAARLVEDLSSMTYVDWPEGTEQPSCRTEVQIHGDSGQRTAVCFPENPQILPDGEYEVFVEATDEDGATHEATLMFEVDSAVVDTSPPHGTVATDPADFATVELDFGSRTFPAVSPPWDPNPPYQIELSDWDADGITFFPDDGNGQWVHCGAELAGSVASCETVVSEVEDWEIQSTDPHQLTKGWWAVDFRSYDSDGRPVRAVTQFAVGAEVRTERAGGGKVAVDDAVTVTVIDLGAAGAEAVSAEVTASGWSVDEGDFLESSTDIVLSETGADTGVFTGTFTAGSPDLVVENGFRIEVVYTDPTLVRRLGHEETEPYRWHSVPIRVGSWPMCGAPPCIESIELNGGAPPAELELDVVLFPSPHGSYVDMAFSFDGRHDIVAGTPLTQLSEVAVSLDLGDFDPVQFTSSGWVVDYEIDPVENTMDVTLRPRPMAFKFDLNTGGNADFDLQGGLSMALYALDGPGDGGEFRDAARGGWFATNAQRYTPPLWDPENEAFVFDVEAPSFTRTGDSFKGFLQSFLPYGQLELMGLEDPEALPDVGLEDALQVTLNDFPAPFTVRHTGYSGIDGVLVQLSTFGYSQKSVAICLDAENRFGCFFDDDGGGPGGGGPGGGGPGGGDTPPTTPAPGVINEVTQPVPAGGTVTTDPTGAGVSASVPVQTSVTSPVAGTVSIVVAETGTHEGEAPAGFTLLGVEVYITAPDATSGDPLILEFELHSSLLPEGESFADVTVFRNGVAVPACTGRAGVAAPDPCVSARVVDGDVMRLTVLTSKASLWQFGVTDGDPAGETPVPLDPPVCGEVPAAGFSDVPRSNVHAAAIDCAVYRGIAHGFSASTYGPALPVTRAQMASFLLRTIESAGAALPARAEQFTDISGNVHEQAISRLASAGIVRGTTATTYEPEAPVTREQMASFLVRTASYITGAALDPGTHRFVDTIDSAHRDAINAAAAAGITHGKTTLTFAPKDPVRRDQMASFLIRTLTLALA